MLSLLHSLTLYAFPLTATMNTDTIRRFDAMRAANFPWLMLTGLLKPHEIVNLYLAIGWAIDEALLAPVALYNKLPRRILRDYSPIINWKAASLSYRFTWYAVQDRLVSPVPPP